MSIHDTKCNHSCKLGVNYICADPCDYSAMSKLAEKLKRWRLERGMDLTTVAGKLEISRQAYYKIEDGSVENPKIDTLIALARLYGTSVSALIDDPAIAYASAKGSNPLELRESDLPVLSPSEHDLIQTFRQADVQQQELIVALISQFQPRKSTPNRRLPLPGKTTGSVKKVPPVKKPTS